MFSLRFNRPVCEGDIIFANSISIQYRINMDNKPQNKIKVMLAERMKTNKDLAERLGKYPAPYPDR